MIIKKITPDTEYLADFVSAVAFEYNTDFVKSRDEAKELQPESGGGVQDESPADKAVRWGAFTDDMSECMATVWSTPFPVRFGHRMVFMGGIGGVSCLPHYRDKGAIKAIMKEMLRDDFKRGLTIDYLYPFSRAYYRQYGFENAVERRVYSISFSAISALVKKPAVGRFYMIRPDMDYSVLDAVYARAYQETNLSTCWLKPSENLKKSGGADKMRYIYVYEDESGVPRGYIAFTGEDGTMNCVNGFGHPAGFVFDNSETLVQLLRFCARMFTSRYNSLKISIPGYVRPEALIPEMNNVSVKVDTQGMIRIVSVERAFENILYKGSGEVTVRAYDPVIEENTGCWNVKWSGGKLVSVSRTDSDPDIECDIAALSVITAGAVRTEEMRWLPNLKINNPDKDLSGIFYYKESFVTSLF